MEDIQLNPCIGKLIDLHIFERLIFLDEKQKGEVKKVYLLGGMKEEYMLA